MSFDYESTLQLFLHLKSDETFNCLSELINVPLIKGISWRLKASKYYKETDSRLYLQMYVGAEVDTQNLSFAIRINVKPTVFSRTSGFFALDHFNNTDLLEGFQTTGEGNYDFQKVLEDNKFDLELKATLTIRSSMDLLAPTLALTEFNKDLSNPDLADFTIQIGSETWKAHKLILSARSPVFRRMLANKECEESKQSLLKIVDVSKETFEIFFQFLYSKRVSNLSLEQATDVLIVADKYDVQWLKNLCDNLLVKLLQQTDSVHDIFQFAHAYNCSLEIKQKAFGFVKSTILGGKNLCDELVEMPEQVNTLVEMMVEMGEKMKEFDKTLKKMNAAAMVVKKQSF